MRFPFPLRFSVPGILLLFGLVLGGIAFRTTTLTSSQQIEALSQERAGYLGKKLAVMSEYLLSKGDLASSQQEIASFSSEANLQVALLCDDSNRILGSTRTQWVARHLAETPFSSDLPLVESARSSGREAMTTSTDRQTVTAAYPFRISTTGSQARRPATGVIYLRYDLIHARRQARLAAIRNSWKIAALLAALCTLAWAFFHLSLTSRVGRLVDATRRLAQGQPDARANLGGCDELAQLSDAFSRMAEEIQARNVALRNSEEQLRAAADSLAEGLLFTDLEGVVLYANPRMASLTGYTPGELIGRRAYELLTPPEGWSEAKERHVRRQQGQSEQYELEFTRKDGTRFWSQIQAAPLRSSTGAIVGTASAINDVTDRRKAEEAIRRLNSQLERRVEERTMELQESVKEMETFSYSISHDLRAPLRAINGFSRILLEELEGKLDQDSTRHLKIVAENGQKMGQLVDDLLAFSRLGRQQLSSEAVDVSALVRAVVEEYRALEPDRDVSVRIHPLPGAVGDPALLRQLFTNLISNAFKYTRRTPNASIEIGTRQVRSSMVYFIQDNGAGFDMQYADKLFGVFQRLHHASEFEGHGVGLAFVHRIIHRHGGNIWAEASPGRGASFFFTLPLAS